MHFTITPDSYSKTSGDNLVIGRFDNNQYVRIRDPATLSSNDYPVLGITVDNGFTGTEIYHCAGVLIATLEESLRKTQAHCLLFNATAKDRGSNLVFLELLIGTLHGALALHIRDNRRSDISTYFVSGAIAAVTCAASALTVHYSVIADVLKPNVRDKLTEEYAIYTRWRKDIDSLVNPEAVNLKLPMPSSVSLSTSGGRPVGGFTKPSAGSTTAPIGPFIMGNVPLFGIPTYYDDLKTPQPTTTARVIESLSGGPGETSTYFRTTGSVKPTPRKKETEEESMTFYAEHTYQNRVSIGDEMVLAEHSPWAVSAIEIKGILTVPPKPLYTEDHNLFLVKSKETGLVSYVVIEKKLLADCAHGLTEEPLEEEVAESVTEKTEAMLEDTVEESVVEEADVSESENNEFKEEAAEMAEYSESFDVEKLMSGKVVDNSVSDKDELRAALIADGKMKDPKAPAKVMKIKSQLLDAMVVNASAKRESEKRQVEANKTGAVRYAYQSNPLTGASIDTVLGKSDMENFTNGFPFLPPTSFLWVHSRQDIVPEADIEQYANYVSTVYEPDRVWASDWKTYNKQRTWHKLFNVSHALLAVIMRLEYSISNIRFDCFAEDMDDVLEAILTVYDEDVFDMVTNQFSDTIPWLRFIRKKTMPECAMALCDIQFPVGVMNLLHEKNDRLSGITAENPVAQVSRQSDPVLYDLLFKHAEHTYICAQNANKGIPLFNIILENNKQYFMTESRLLEETFMIAEVSSIAPIVF